MALFESYERREKQILAKLEEYGIHSVEEAAEVTKAAGLDVYKIVEGIQPICCQMGLYRRRGNRYQKRLSPGGRCCGSYRRRAAVFLHSRFRSRPA